MLLSLSLLSPLPRDPLATRPAIPRPATRHLGIQVFGHSRGLAGHDAVGLAHVPPLLQVMIFSTADGRPETNRAEPHNGCREIVNVAAREMGELQLLNRLYLRVGRNGSE